MAGLIQRAVNSLFVKDSDTSRVRDNIVSALNPVLTFLTSNFAQNGPVISFLKAVTGTSATFTGPLSAGACTLAGDLVVNGNVFCRTRTGNGFVITPPVAGPAFYVTNIAGNSARFLVTDTGAVSSADNISGLTVTSSVGFKTVVSAGTMWNSAYVANTNTLLQDAVVNLNGGGNGLTPVRIPMTHKGSVVGISFNEAGPITGSHTFYVIANTTTIATWIAGAGANNATFRTTYPKGVVAFQAGDVLNFYIANSSAGNMQIKATVTLEMDS